MAGQSISIAISILSGGGYQIGNSPAAVYLFFTVGFGYFLAPRGKSA
jgi:hypothetical protein